MLRKSRKNGLTIRKYEEHARWLMYRIPLHRPIPSLIINLSNLSTRIKQELVDLNNEALDYVLREAIDKIFESINERYFRLNVRRLLQWEIDE